MPFVYLNLIFVVVVVITVTRLLNDAVRERRASGATIAIRSNRTIDQFVEHVVKSTPILSPFHCIDGTHYAHVVASQLYFVLVCAEPIAASFAIDLLTRLARVFDDYCGTASEESLRLNVVLLHELLDDIVDTGVVQNASTARLRTHLFNEAAVPATVAPSAAELLLNSLGLAGGDNASAAAAAASRPLAVHRVDQRAVSSSGNGTVSVETLATALVPGAGSLAATSASLAGVGNDVNAIYVDVRERLTLAIDLDGRLRRSDVDGDITLLSTVRGSPLVRMRLGDNVQLRSAVVGAGVSRDAWGSERVLQLHADSGRSTVLRYRAPLQRTATASGGLPAQIAGRVTFDVQRRLLCMRLRFRACVAPALYLSDVVVRVRVPRVADVTGARCVVRRNGAANDSSASFEATIDAGTAAQRRADVGERASLLWRTERVYGGAELLLAVDMSLSDVVHDGMSDQMRTELSPLLCSFVASNWCASGASVSLKADDALSDAQTLANTRRWVAQSTTCELVREFEWAAPEQQ